MIQAILGLTDNLYIYLYIYIYVYFYFNALRCIRITPGKLLNEGLIQ